MDSVIFLLFLLVIGLILYYCCTFPERRENRHSAKVIDRTLGSKRAEAGYGYTVTQPRVSLYCVFNSNHFAWYMIYLITRLHVQVKLSLMFLGPLVCIGNVILNGVSPRVHVTVLEECS